MERAPETSDFRPALDPLPWPSAEIDLVSRFEQCVASFGPRPALVAPSGIWSYDSLNRAANLLAREILALRGNGSEPVALLLDEAPSFLVASLAVLKAGKFYLPLDPAFPKERNAYILSDGAARLLLTSSHLLKAAHELAQADTQVFAVDNLPESSMVDEENLQLDIPPSAPAMLIYTSGSTGRPKGVLHSHRGLAHNAMRQNDLMRISPMDRCTMLYSTSVMGMTRDMFNALLHGASLYRFDLRTAGLSEMVTWIAQNQITILHTISSVYRHLDDILESPLGLESLRLVILGGEEVLRFDVELFRRFFPPDCQLFVGLGLSEAGTIRAQLLTRTSVVDSSIVPIGYPVRGVEILLLGPDGLPVPNGEIGEIAVRSEHIAVAYWNNPAGTSASFKPDPDGSGRQLFLTGDLGRFLPDGALVHCGRKDFQVKIRGFRIELLEIEAALLETGLVLDATAMVYEVGPGDKRLVAFIVPRPGQESNLQPLRELLSRKLPDHMLPSLFIELDSLPRTPNGKIERRSLPQPDFGTQADAHDTPQTDTEAALVELWKETLSVSQVGVHDNFFDLGGNSLLAGTLLARMSRQFGRDYPLSLLTEYDTVAKLAALLQNPNSGRVRLLVAVKPEGNRVPLFLVPGGYGDVLYLRHLARHLDSEQPLYGLQAGGFDGQSEYLPNTEQIAAAYIAEILKIQPSGPFLVAGHSFGGYVALEIARQLKASNHDIALVGLLDTYPPGKRRQAPWPKRLNIHWNNLRGRNWRGRSQYFRQRFVYFLPRLLRHQRLASLPALNRLGRENRLLVSRLARYTYMPAPYNGKVILIKAMERDWYVNWDPMETWPRFTPNLEIFETEGEHAEIMFEPYVGQVARHLEQAINQALSAQGHLDTRRAEASPVAR